MARSSAFWPSSAFRFPSVPLLTSGLAYVWAVGTRHNISTFVALIAGLSLFERLSTLEVVDTLTVIREIASTIVVSGGGTFFGLIAGWGVGFVTGSITRLLLSRPYRSLQSAAYDLLGKNGHSTS